MITTMDSMAQPSAMLLSSELEASRGSTLRHHVRRIARYASSRAEPPLFLRSCLQLDVDVVRLTQPCPSARTP